jgi:hypothetical protein
VLPRRPTYRGIVNANVNSAALAAASSSHGDSLAVDTESRSASGEAFCLVTIQGGREHVSPVTVSERDAASLLAVETLLHRAAGWHVVGTERFVVARRGKVTRIVSARPRRRYASRKDVHRRVA